MQTMKKNNRITLYVGVILFLLIWASCVNPYKYLPNKPPLTPKDTAALLARCIAISPIDTADTVYIPPLPIPPDSTDYFKAISDSLSKVKQLVRDSILIKYKDTCTSAVRIYNEAYRLGYDIGKSDASINAEKTYACSYRTTDSLYRIQTGKLKHDYNLRLIAAENAKNIAQVQTEKYRNKYSRLVKWTWGLSVAFLLAVIICILLWKFKRQAKAANSIINSGQDIVESVKKLK